MEFSRREARAGVGGGICQSSNLLYWLALHSPLNIVERHHHRFEKKDEDYFRSKELWREVRNKGRG